MNGFGVFHIAQIGLSMVIFGFFYHIIAGKLIADGGDVAKAVGQGMYYCLG